MGKDFIPTTDDELESFATLFATRLASDPSSHGMTAGEATSLTAAVQDFATAVTEVATLQAATAAALAKKKARRAALKVAIRQQAARIQVLPGMTGGLLGAAGLPVHDTKPSQTTPVPPTALVCIPHANGFNTLRWKRNGNSPKTMFDIEAKRGAAAEYTHVYTVTATKYEDPCPAGVPVMYRVRARRHKQVSDPSNTAGVSWTG